MKLLPVDRRAIEAVLRKIQRDQATAWTHAQVADKALTSIKKKVKQGDLLWRRALDGLVLVGLVAMSRHVAGEQKRLERPDGGKVRLRTYVSVRQRKPDGTLSSLFVNQAFLDLPVDEADAYALQMKKRAADMNEIAEGYEAITRLRELYPDVLTYGEAVKKAGWTLEQEEDEAA